LNKFRKFKYTVYLTNRLRHSPFGFLIKYPMITKINHLPFITGFMINKTHPLFIMGSVINKTGSVIHYTRSMISKMGSVLKVSVHMYTEVLRNVFTVYILRIIWIPGYDQ